MKILQVIDSLEIGGAEKVFIDLTNLLHEQQFSVSAFFILKPGIWESQLHSRIPRYILNRRWKWSPSHMIRCSRIISQFNIIHCHHRYIYAYINICAKIYNVKSKVVLHDHYGLIEIDKSVPFNISGIFRPSYYIGVSRKLNMWAKEQLKIDSNSVFLLTNIVRAFSYNNSILKKYDWVIVSNIKPVKNQIFAVELAKYMKKTLLIIGNIQDQTYYEQLQKSAKGSEQQIQIRTDIKDVRPYLRQAKLGLHVSKSETGPLALIEYLSVGLPFVSYNTGEVSEIVKVNFPEFILSSFDIDTWINNIKKIEENDINKYASQLLHFYESNFGENKYVQKCLKIYQSILGVS